MPIDSELRRRLRKRIKSGTRRNVRKLSDAQILDILTAYADGEGIVALARANGVHEGAIRYHIRKAIGE